MLTSVAAEEAAIDAYLARFVPPYRRDLLLHRQGGQPAARNLSGVVLYVDIAGFTALTGELTHNRAVGAEQVAADVNRVLTGIGAIAAKYGGELLHFAGDAAWIAWLGPPSAEIGSFCRLAATAAADVHRAAGEWLLGAQPVKLRCSIGAGALEQLELGGYRGQWVGLLRGAGIDSAIEADRYSAPEAIVVAPQVWTSLRGHCRGSAAGGGYIGIERIDATELPPVPRPAAEINRPMGAALPPMVAFRGQDDRYNAWAGEFRTAHVIFGRVAGSAGLDAAKLHAIVGEVQRQLDRSAGSLYQVLADEKGLAVVAAYGLPPQVHAGDASRALETTISLRAALSDMGVEAHFALATGRLFCTIYGSGDGLQFALVGPALNLAARLADGQDAVVADAATAAAAPLTLAVRALPPRILKGIADPVQVFGIQQRTRPAEVRSVAATDAPVRLVGRSEELERCTADLDNLAGGQGGLLVIEGESGVGKSALARAIAAMAGARKLPVAIGAAAELQQNTYLRPWRPVLREALAGMVSAHGLTEEALDALGPNRPHSRLLASALELPVHEAEAVASMNDEGRAQLVHRMVIDLLAAATRQSVLIVVLEDLQWFDSGSLALLRAIGDAELPILVVATQRPGQDGNELADVPHRKTILLRGLDVDQTALLLARACGAASSDADLARKVEALTSGNPFFIGQVGAFLLDHGRLRVIGGEVVAADENVTLEDSFRAFGVPATLEGVVMGRLDARPAPEREIVRVCAVLGSTFDRGAIAALLERQRPVDVDGLLTAGILSADAETLSFRHAILRDVAYSTLSMADRSRLHGAAARYLSARRDASDGQLDAVLAHHYEQAGQVAVAIPHLLAAGKLSLRNNANREALALNARGLALLEELPGDQQAAFSEAAIALRLGAGEAAQRLSRYDDAQRHKDAALAAMGGPLPMGAAVLPALLREVMAQVVRRTLPMLASYSARPAARQLKLSAETAELVEIYFYRGDSLRSLYAALRSLNLAEGSGDTPQLARGFGIVGTIAGFARLRGIAKRYGERALDILSRIDDPVAAWWVPLVVGVSRLSAGELTVAADLMQRTAIASDRIRDRRHWRDAIENLGIIAALRGDWNLALDHVAAYRATAVEDHDQRYLVAALREQAYCLLQLGRIEECERSLALLRAELGRGVRAEEAASRQDLHAIGAAVALRKGDLIASRQELASGMAVMTQAAQTSFPNMFWSLGALFDVAAQLGDEPRALLISRALDRHAASHAVGRPAALRARGRRRQQSGHSRTAQRWFDRAAQAADMMGMARGHAD